MKRVLSLILAMALAFGCAPVIPVTAESVATDNAAAADGAYDIITVDPSLYPESEHAYGVSLNESKSFTWPGAEKLVVTFSDLTYVEDYYDSIYLYDATGTEIAYYTGAEAANQTVEIAGDTVTVLLTSDGSVVFYGYSFASIVAHVPQDSSCEEYLTWSMVGENAIITGCDTSVTGNLVIPTMLDGCVVTEIGDGAFQNCSGITGMTVAYGVTTIGANAFQGCSNLKNLQIVGDRLASIGENAFDGCTALTDVWYRGEQSDFAIAEGNEALESATWHSEICAKNPVLGDHVFEDFCCIYCQKKEFPIASIELEKTEIEIIEHTDGYYEGDDCFVYHIMDYGRFPEFVAVLKDGTRVRSEGAQITINDDRFYLVDNSFFSQAVQPWTVGNTYDVECSVSYNTMEYAGGIPITVNLQVSIVESPVESIEIQNVSIVEFTNGEAYDDFYMYNMPSLQGTVTFKDGTQQSFTDSIEINGNTYWINANSRNMQWDEPWLAGNTYTVTGSFVGVTDTFTVTITESPIASIEIDDISIMEFTNGYYQEDTYYYELYDRWFTITYKDGTTQRCNGGVEIDGTWYNVDFDIYSQYQNPWTAGNTYALVGSFMGVSDTFYVSITGGLIESIEIEDQAIMECTNGYYQGGTYYYELYNIWYTVTLRDGTTQRVNGSIELDGLWYSLRCDMSSQRQEPWVGGNTYTVTAYLMGASDTFQITITESPVASVEIEDVSVVEFSNGRYEDGIYFYEIHNLQYTVTFRDGTTERTDGGIQIDGQWYHVESNLYIQREEPWVAGNTYTLTGHFMGASDTFQVTIVESPVVSVEIEDVTVVEYTNGHYAGNTYYYELYNLWYTVTYRDGTTERLRGEIKVDDMWYGVEIDMSSQQMNPWTAGNTYTVTGSFMGISDTFTVTITGGLVKDIEIEDISVLEFTEGYYDGDRYQYTLHNLICTLTYQDGTTEQVFGGLQIDDVWYGVELDMSSQYMNPWTAGNTYTATGTFMGVADTFQVTIIENPIDSIEFEDITLQAFTNGEYRDGNFYYYLPPINVTITYKDGTTQVINDYFDLNGEQYWANHDAWDRQEEEPWVAGNTYAVTGHLMDFSDTFYVTIQQGAVESIEIEDISIVEGSYGKDYSGAYNIMGIYYTVNFRDGTSVRTNEGMMVDDQWCSLVVDTSSQAEEPWVAGNTYVATGTFMDITDTFYVTIVPGPVSQIEFKDIVLYQGIDSNSSDYYSVSPAVSQILLKNGEVAYGNGLAYEGAYYTVSNNAYDLQQQETWSVGNTYQVTGTLFGVSGTFNVTILENPIKELELIKGPDNAECIRGQYLNYKGTEVRIHYYDGDYEDVVFENDITVGYAPSYYSEKLQRSSRIQLEGYFTETGMQTAPIVIFNHAVYVSVNIKENLTQNVHISEDQDRFIVVTVFNSDDTRYQVKLLDICYMFDFGDGQFVGYVLTEQGILEIWFFVNESGFSIGMALPDGGMITSNTLDSCPWFDMAKRVDDFNDFVPYLDQIQNLAAFTGEVTAENIDTLLMIAGRMMISLDAEYEKDAQGRMMVPGDVMKDAVLTHFVVDDVDLTLSENYDPDKDIYLYYLPYDGGMAEKCVPNEVTYEDGVWLVTSTNNVPGSGVMQLKLDESLRVLEFSYVVEGPQEDPEIPEDPDPEEPETPGNPEAPVCVVMPDQEGTVINYYTLGEAMAATTSGSIKLLADTSVDTAILMSGVTLDLNGYTLTAEVLIVMNGATITDGEGCVGGGMLKIQEENLVFIKENGQSIIPLWNGVDGYIFTKVTFLEMANPAGTDASQYIFLPRLSNAAATALLTDGGLDNGVKIKVGLTWNNGQCQQFYTYGEELVSRVFASGGKLVFSLTITGISGITDMTASAMLITESGAQTSATGIHLATG